MSVQTGRFYRGWYKISGGVSLELEGKSNLARWEVLSMNSQYLALSLGKIKAVLPEAK